MYHQWKDDQFRVQLPFRERYPEGLPKICGGKAKQQQRLESYPDDEAVIAAYTKFKEEFVDQGFLMPMPEHLEKQMFKHHIFLRKRIVVNCA